MEKKYKKAVDFLNATGAGLTREDKLLCGNIMVKVETLCPDFERLDRIFFGRAGINPPMIADREDGAGDAARVLLGDGPAVSTPEGTRPPTPFSEIDMTNVRVDPEIVEVLEDPPVEPPKNPTPAPDLPRTSAGKPKFDSADKNPKKPGKNPVKLDKPEPPKKILPDVLMNMPETKRISDDRKFKIMERKLDQQKTAEENNHTYRMKQLEIEEKKVDNNRFIITHKLENL